MKVFISFDMEGVAGISDWAHCLPEGRDYHIGVGLTLGEVNAAIEGAAAAGATEFVVNDSHYKMRNLDPRDLAKGARYLSGAHKPLYMMQGLNASFDAVFFVGYHGSISGEPSILSHSYSPSTFSRIVVDDQEVGEAGINALVARHFEVPIALITGDQVGVAQNGPLLGNPKRVVVKESITRDATESLHPDDAKARIYEAAKYAIAEQPSLPLAPVASPVEVRLEFLDADMAEIATWIVGVERTGTRSAMIRSDDRLRAFRSFVGVSYLTRQVSGR
jgi:D-amino peptidase